jgi:hypothetical protein
LHFVTSPLLLLSENLAVTCGAIDDGGNRSERDFQIEAGEVIR